MMPPGVYDVVALPEFKVGGTTDSASCRNNDGRKLVIDCGADSVKMGFGGMLNPTRIAPNFVARGGKKGTQKYVAEEIENCEDFSKLILRRPFDRGYLLDWEIQKQVWSLSESYSAVGKKFNPSSTQLLMTEPYFNPESLRTNMYEVIFEDYQFAELCTVCPATLALFDANMNRPEFSTHPAGIVVDTGYSFSHIVPFFDNTKLTYAIKRIDVGGKVITNYLKEVVSHRHWNMMEATYLINNIKERVCYVSLDFEADMRLCRLKKSNKVRRQYVLPDYVTSTLGYVKGVDELPPMPVHMMGQPRPEEQILEMTSERLIPEVLFRPSDLGIPQAGIAEAIVQSVQECCPDLHEALYNNVILCGGNCFFPGFKERLEAELRSLIPQDYKLNVYQSADPKLAAWRGGSRFVQSPNFRQWAVTKAEYEEGGVNNYLVCKRRFDAM
eukprot:TRINITY_DN4839_c0_g1_i1.p1 TRINITY_DN4839_c0_g1~~TRINITY_DN4839_c0_g1_i1.p1  ORF type:complete len:441 (-),score=73.48 TRINITY_DN4839_c0_g1_i1:44-1366(-)